ncbi:probable ATP-dependent RNA helicase DDX52 [Diadema setosum]|uniref:probable ATP-dependent RNA helicase DDX52 n=1 Tax=Diadema setosum TaxID=31175 RepID=UPI003B3BB62C
MATAMSLFRQLGAGAKFDLKRFRSDAEKFHLVRASSKQLPQQDIVKALDIFGQDKEGQSSQKLAEEPHGEKRKADDVQQERDKKKRKKQKAQEKIPETSDGEEKLSEEKVKQRRVEKVKSIRKRNRIYVQGEDIPDPVESFEELSSEYQLDPYVINNITRAGYESPTPVQMQAVPVMMHRRELLACAPTGSGKTAAFLLPVMHHLKGPKKKGFRAIIVSPTRELAQQTYRELMRLSEGSGLRIHTIEHGAKAMQKFGPKTAQKFDILVTTPNRLVYLLQQDPPAINLSNVEWLIVDESDKLFEEGKTGFRDQLGTIYQACDSSHVRRAMFSATFAYDVEQWCRLNLDNVVTVSVGARNTANEQIEQELTFVGGEYGKLLAVRDIFSKGFTPPVLVFVQSKERAKELFQELIYDGYNVDVIHADKTQTQRDNIVKGFRSGKIWVLIATELMGRGIDFKGVNLVINYDFPTSAISYIHRIGRTGRAGRAGRAVTFFTEDDTVHLRSIANVMRNAGCPVPDYMLQIRRLSKKKKKALEKHPVKRDTIRTLPKQDLQRAKRKREMMKKKTKRKKAKPSGGGPPTSEMEKGVAGEHAKGKTKSVPSGTTQATTKPKGTNATANKSASGSRKERRKKKKTSKMPAT